jgi:hypothetical protein
MFGKWRPLFGGLFPWRIKRAGIVNFGHLVIAEAKHLPQDFVGVFAEQRRALHVGRAVRQLDGIANRQVLAAGLRRSIQHRQFE